MRFPRFLAAFAAVLMLSGCDLDARALRRGATAFEDGDYQTAIDLWRPLAEAGNAEAQFNLGEMHYLGRGMDQNYPEAMTWFLQAARGGNGMACLRLGMMFSSEQGVELDFVEAYKWIRLAQARDTKNAELARAALVKRLSAEEIVEAERLAEAWAPSPVD